MMLKLEKDKEMSLSEYSKLYDILISGDNFWRRLNAEVDFSFINEEIQTNYSLTMGRPSEYTERMFKFLLLKSYYNLSDRDLVERAKTDMAFKFFLGYNPEDTKLIDPSLLTVFRRQRLKSNEDNLLDKLIKKTVQIAIEKGVIKAKNKMIVDSTHSLSMFSHISPREKLIQLAKELRKSVYKIDESMHDKMPKKKKHQVF